MKQILEIQKEPKKVRHILTVLKKGNYFSKTFDGQIADGSIKGVFTNLALLNPLVIGYVRITGSYNLDKGDLILRGNPTVLYWIVLSFSLVAAIIFGLSSFNSSKLNLVGAVLFLVLALGFTGAYLWETSIFKRSISKQLL